MSAKDIQALSKPKSLQPIVKRVGEYVAAMKLLSKPVAHVTLMAKDYDAIMRSVQSRRQDHDPEITGLRYGDIRVDRKGS